MSAAHEAQNETRRFASLVLGSRPLMWYTSGA
jgi:hypothetical protein